MSGNVWMFSDQIDDEDVEFMTYIDTACVERIMKGGLKYVRSGDYFIPNLTLPEEPRPIGKWGRMHREYLREYKPIQYNCLLLSGKLWTYLRCLVLLVTT